MNKGKFASLIMLGVFSAGVASSSAVSARGDENLVSVVDNKGASSHDDSVTTDFKFSDESVSVSGETKIDTETTTDENNNARNVAENLDKNIENKTDLPEDLDKENKEDTDYMFVGDKIEKSEDDKEKKIKLAKGIAVAVAGVSAIGAGAFSVPKLVKSSGDDKKKEKPIIDKDDKREEQFIVGDDKKEKQSQDNPVKKKKPAYFILASIASLLFIWVLFCFIRTVYMMSTYPNNGYIIYKPFFGLFENRSTSYISKLGLKMFVYYLGVYFIASKDVYIDLKVENKQ